LIAEDAGNSKIFLQLQRAESSFHLFPKPEKTNKVSCQDLFSDFFLRSSSIAI
jgi:hypothetical protein